MASPSGPRPLSPHLQIFRWHILMATSIGHRISGVVLALGLPVLAWWLSAAASGPEAYYKVTGMLGSWYGQLALLVWSLAFWYHLANGVRHLIWDSGHGLELEPARKGGWAVMALAPVLTAATWLVAWLAW